MPEAFVGRSRALTRQGLDTAARSVTVGDPEIWAILAVETSGRGFLPDRRPQMLYERHIFHELTDGRFDDGDISDHVRGGYGARGAHQYDRLGRAIEKDRAAALRSASWGLGQILGRNCGLAGFVDVDAFVQAMSDGEDAQLSAVTAFIRATGIDAALQAHDWTTFARGYNGPAFAQNQYDVRLRGEYEKYSSGLAPDLDVRAAQLYLRFLGFDAGPVDGLAGPLTRSAILDYQRRQGLAPSGKVDDALLGRLAPVSLVTNPRPT